MSQSANKPENSSDAKVTPRLFLSLNGEHHEITSNPNESILDAALRNGIDVPYSCMSGTCNSCQAKLTEGKVEMEFSDALTEEEISDGEILTCQAVPLTESVRVVWPD